MRGPENHGGARVGVVELGRHDVLDHRGSDSRVLGGCDLQPGHRDLRELLELAFPLALRRLSGHQTSERNLLPLHESYQRFFEALEFPCERRQKVRIFREALPEGRNRVRGLRHCSARN